MALRLPPRAYGGVQLESFLAVLDVLVVLLLDLAVRARDGHAQLLHLELVRLRAAGRERLEPLWRVARRRVHLLGRLRVGVVVLVGGLLLRLLWISEVER